MLNRTIINGHLAGSMQKQLNELDTDIRDVMGFVL